MQEKVDAFPIVGIGASFGGLEACRRLLSGLPPDTGAVFVLIQPDDPAQAALEPDVLAPHTPMPVREAAAGVVPEPDTLYVVPPGRFLRLAAEGPFLDASDTGAPLPVDHFFGVLAEVRGPRAIAIVLSGTGSDGTRGLGWIKDQGGLVIVQSPEDAEHDAMPRAAIGAGRVDLIAAADSIGRALAGFLPRPERQRLDTLEHELQSTRRDLHATIGEMEAANAELRTSNAAVTRMNERLRSTNEELETSRAKLQALNDELSRVNTRLEGKVQEVEAARNDLSNLLTSTRIAVIFLDRDMLIRSFTPAVRDVLRIADSDVGRPVADVATRVSDSLLLEHARRCLEDLHEAEAEIETHGGSHLIRRVRPYLTGDDRVDGVVVTYSDVTRQRGASDRARRREAQQATVADLGRMALAGEGFDRLFGHAVHEIEQHLNVRYAKILELMPDGAHLLLRAGIGWKEGLVGRIQLGTGMGSQAGYTLMRASPVIVQDFAHETRFAPPPLLHDHGIVCGASVIIGPVSAPWGVLGAHESELGRCTFTVDDVNFLQSVATMLWLAISFDRERRADAREAERLRELTNALPVELSIVGRDMRIELLNDTYRSYGIVPEDHIGKSIASFVGEATFAEIRPRLARVLEGESQSYELSFERPDGRGLRHEIIHHVPRRNRTGEIDGVINVAIDITGRRTLERQLERSNRIYRTLGDTIPYGIWITDAEGQLVYVSDSFLKMVGRSLEEMRDLGWLDALEDGSGDEVLAAWRDCLAAGDDWEREHRFASVEGRTVHVLSLGRPVRGPDGEIVTWVGLNLDITQRKFEEERLELVTAELDHRVKNILATVSTIARMTGRSATSLEDYREGLESRLMALASAHQILAEANWSGMELDTLLHLELGAHAHPDGAVRIEGPRTMLRAPVAQALALAFHELTANAARFGALSVTNGRVEVTWDTRPDGTTRLRWRETGLPAPPRPGTRGFGTTVLTTVLAAQIEAETRMDFRKDGLVFELSLPAEVAP